LFFFFQWKLNGVKFCFEVAEYGTVFRILIDLGLSMSKQDRNLTLLVARCAFLDPFAHPRSSGYKPEIPEPEFENSAVALWKLRRLVSQIVLDESGVCE